MTAQLDPDAKTGNPNLTTCANCEKAVRHQGGALLAKKLKTGAAQHTAKNPANNRLRK